MSHMRSASVIGCCGALFAVEAGRVCQAETLERTVAYLDSWSPVSFVGCGTLEVGKGFGIGTFSGPSVGSLNGCSSGGSQLEVLELVARSPDVEWEDSADWKDAALEVGCALESEGGSKLSSAAFSLSVPLTATVGFGLSGLAA